MRIDQLLPILCCPHCGSALHRSERTIACGGGHHFDVARQGHLNLLGQAPPAHADSTDMVAARLRFLNVGHYEPVVDEILRQLPQSSPQPVWCEAGAGPGWYLQQLLDQRPEAVGLASDISVAAARRAAKAHPRLAAIVSDTWRRWPVRDQSVDLVLTVFAPRNSAEFARVLRPGGRLIVVMPRPDHLASLRTQHDLLEIDADKPERLAASLTEHFTPCTSAVIHRGLALDAAAVSDLIGMGPNAHHPRATVPEPITTDLSVTVSGWQRNP